MILIFGTICLDRVRRVPSLPSTGGYVEALDETIMVGGEAANTALALQKWGAQIELAGNSLGAGSEGEALEKLVRESGLPMDHLSRGDVDAPVCDIYVTPDGERTMFGRGFSAMQGSIDPASIPYRPGEWFTAEPNMAGAASEVARLAHDAGMMTYLMDFIRPGDPVAPGSFWQSSTDWSGVRGDALANIEWVRQWVAEKDCFTIVTDGPRGFVAGSREHEIRAYPPYPAPITLDSTGAGDMFRSGMLYGLDQDWEIADCLRFASAAGALACGGLGATGKIPTAQEIRSLLEAEPDISAAYDG
ncbi:MAG: carbohydrate kinase family protein [Fimbriimonadaceae bacterium]